MSSVRTFVELFSLGTGPLAASEAPPAQRLPVLIEALNSNAPRRQRLALMACDEALQIGSSFRVVDSEPVGLRTSHQLWSPSTGEEVIDAYRQVWQLVREQVDLLAGHERQEAVRILLRRARDVVQLHPLSDLVLETLLDLNRRSLAEHKQIVECVEEIVHYEGRTLPLDLLDRWRALREELVERDFSTLLQRYVGAQLLHDWDDDGERSGEQEKPLTHLARQAVNQPDLLDPEFAWLLAGEAPAGLGFGYELAQLDSDRRLLPRLLDRLREFAPRGNGFLLGGYLRHLAETDLEQWEELLDRLADDGQLRTLVPELTWRGRLTDRAADRILRLAKNRSISSSQFAMFGLGGVIREVSEDSLRTWLEFLLNDGSQRAIATSLQLYFYYYIHDRKDGVHSRELGWKILTHKALFQDQEGSSLDSMVGHAWKRSAMKFLDGFPDDGLAMAKIILDSMREKGGIDSGLSSPIFSVLDRILDIDPRGAWSLVAPLLGPPIDERAFRLAVWLHGTQRAVPKDRDAPGAITKIPENVVWAWVEADIEKRAWLIASIAPNGFFRAPNKTCWAREVLARYGDREDVRGNIGANFNIEVTWGPESTYLEKKRSALIAYRPLEDNPRVLRWIDDYVTYLNEQIDRAKTEEERDW